MHQIAGQNTAAETLTAITHFFNFPEDMKSPLQLAECAPATLEGFHLQLQRPDSIVFLYPQIYIHIANDALLC